VGTVLEQAGEISFAEALRLETLRKEREEES
jgi:hypothetical protein